MDERPDAAALHVLTTRVTAGRPLIVAEAADTQSGVDPLSLVLSYNKVLIAASLYDPASGLVVFGLPPQAPALKAGTTPAIVAASDYQESKNINTVGDALMPNTTFRQTPLHVVSGPTVSWLEPPARSCALTHDELFVVADSTAEIKSVVFHDGNRLVGTDRGGRSGVYSKPWPTSGLKHGVHRLTATVLDTQGRSATAGRTIRVCA